jgi:hypothetical protein
VKAKDVAALECRLRIDLASVTGVQARAQRRVDIHRAHLYTCAGFRTDYVVVSPHITGACAQAPFLDILGSPKYRFI